MAYVITQKCVSEVYATCIENCPVDCIHFVEKIPEGLPGAGESMMVIDPENCIDCAACEMECPIGAITVDKQDSAWAKINRDLAPQVIGKKPLQARPRDEKPRRGDNALQGYNDEFWGDIFARRKTGEIAESEEWSEKIPKVRPPGESSND